MPGSPQLPCSISEKQEEKKIETKVTSFLLDLQVHDPMLRYPPTRSQCSGPHARHLMFIGVRVLFEYSILGPSAGDSGHIRCSG
jgi:hypothetical protein